VKEQAANKIPIMGKSAPAEAKLALMLIVFVLCDYAYKFYPLFLVRMPKSFRGPWTQKGAFIVLTVFFGGFLLINVCILLGLAYRKNWARIVGLLLAIFWIGNIALVASTNGSLWRSVNVPSVAYVVAIGLVFLPTTGTWFKWRGTNPDVE
jgi:hypothetical protein